MIVDGCNILMEHFFEAEGVVTLFPSNLNEVCVKVEQGFNEGYAAFTPTEARRIALTILLMADSLDDVIKALKAKERDVLGSVLEAETLDEAKASILQYLSDDE